MIKKKKRNRSGDDGAGLLEGRFRRRRRNSLRRHETNCKRNEQRVAHTRPSHIGQTRGDWRGQSAALKTSDLSCDKYCPIQAQGRCLALSRRGGVQSEIRIANECPAARRIKYRAQRNKEPTDWRFLAKRGAQEWGFREAVPRGSGMWRSSRAR